MKKNKVTGIMPTTKLLTGLSWVGGGVGLLIGGYGIIFRFNEPKAVGSGLLVIFGGIVFAALIRLLGNIGQMIFEISAFHYEQMVDIKQKVEILNNYFKNIADGLFAQLEILREINSETKKSSILIRNSQNSHHSDIIKMQEVGAQIKDLCAQLSCDTKDINRDIYQIKDFFEKIERHLDLNK